jgi:hypothetical protein
MSFLVEIWSYVRVRKKYWLLPVLLLLLLVAALVVLTKGSVLAPFIYTVF